MNESATLKYSELPDRYIPGLPIDDNTGQLSLYEAKSVNINPDYFAVMRNDLIKGRQGTTSIRVAKMLRLMITQILREDTEFKTISVKIKDLANFWDIESKGMYNEIEDLCAQLTKTLIHIKKGKGTKTKWDMFHWVSRCSYENGVVTFRFSDEIKPFLLGLGEFYTQYRTEDFQGFKSWYTLRLYEILCCDYGLNLDKDTCGEFTYTIEQLREYFECQNKYKTTAVFLIKVENAVNEINEKSNIEVWAEYNRAKRRGTPIVSVTFSMKMYRSSSYKREFFGFIQEKDTGRTTLNFVEWKKQQRLKESG